MTMMNKLTFAKKEILYLLGKHGGEKSAAVYDRINLLQDELESVIARRESIQTFFAKGFLDPAVYQEELDAVTEEERRIITEILTNEKYIGDALLQKTCTVSILEKKRAKNDGALPKYYVEGCHEAIISRDIFLQVQSEMRRRANLSAVGKKRVYSGKYALSSIVYCAHCGDIYRRIKWNNRGYRSIVWRCVSRVEKGGPDCTARTVREDELHRAVLTAVNDVLSRKDSFLPILKENIRAVLGEDITSKVEEIDKEIKHRQAELLRPGNSDKQIEKIGDAITYLCESRQEILTEAALKKDTRDRIEDMMRFLDDQICAVTEYSETLTRRLIEKVTVYDEKMVVEFRSGLQIEVDA